MAGVESRYRHRVNTRRPVNCRSLLATGTRAPFRAETIDISSGGIGLLLDVELRPGSPLTVELQFDNPKLDLSLDGVVLHSEAMDGRWFAGIRFVGIGLVAELELSRFVLNEDRMLRANQTERSAPVARDQPAGVEAAKRPAANESTSGSGFYTRLAAAG